jgi:large subunit ribosomal protein L34e
MVRRSFRTRSRKKVKVRTPGGRTVTHFRAEKAKKAVCGRCGVTLSGVATGSATFMGNLPASQKRPARPYGGVLCPGCLDSLVRYVTRTEAVCRAPEYSDMGVQRDLTLEKFLPRGWFASASAGSVLRTAKKSKPKGRAKPAAKKEKPKKAKAKSKKSA